MTRSGGLCERHGCVVLVSAASGHVLPLSLLADRQIRGSGWWVTGEC